MCSPIFNGKIVGVGEAIGTVHPLLGEGTIPSLQCAELLAENLHDLEQYRENVLRNFRIYETAYALIKSKLKGDFTVQSQLPKLRSIFSHMKKNWARYGFHVNMHTILKLFNH
jgi:flavin-dependent dehydrogenase